MNRQHVRIGLLILSALLLSFSPAVAETINFEDLDPAWSDGSPVPAGYAGLNWLNFKSICVDQLNCTGDKTGYVTGTSGTFAVFNDTGLPAEFSSDKPFNFASVHLTAVWSDGLEITVDGYLDDKLVKTVTVTVSPTASQLFTFDFKGVNRVTFTPPEGTPLSGYSDDGGTFFFVMDDLEITSGDPEPTPITIDIKPGDSQNVINPKSRGVIPVAILSVGSFDATKLDLPLVGFGPEGAPPDKTTIEDVDGDGLLDMLMLFRTRSTGIACGDTSATLSIMTLGGEILREGTDSIRTVPCK